MRTCIYDNIEPMRREFWCDRLMVASIRPEELRTDEGRMRSMLLGCEWIDYEPTRTSGDIRVLPE